MEKEVIGQRESKTWKDRPAYVIDITSSLCASSLGMMLAEVLSGCDSLPCSSLKNNVFLCVLSDLCCVSDNKLCTSCYSCFLLETFLLSNGVGGWQEPGPL